MAGAPTPVPEPTPTTAPSTPTATPGPVPAPAPPPSAAAPSNYLVASGHLLVLGKQPDGDSVRFRPQDPDVLRQLAHGERVEPSADGSVQLRLDGIDAPELHYAGHRQPFGDLSRDAFLRLLGFREVTHAANHMTVTAAAPSTVPAVIVARMAEVHGRPVAFLFTGATADALRARHGTHLEVDEGLLAASANLRLLATGDVYPLLYTSTSPALRTAIADVAVRSRAARLGVHAADATSRFSVVDHKSVGQGGDLVLPKLFRRVTEWLRETRAAAASEAAADAPVMPPQTFPAWLRANPGRNDRVHVAGNPRTQALHTLVQQSGTTVTMTADPLGLVFVER